MTVVMKLIKSLFLICFLFSLTSKEVQAQDDEKMANNLIKLRGEVEDLQSEMKILKSEYKNSMSYLSTRKTELQANVDRKLLHIKQTQLEYSKLQEQVKLLGADSEELIPQVSSLILSIKDSLNAGIPFKYIERLSVIETIERKLNARKITSQNAINRLWAFLEDEIRLTRENAIYSQTIELNGENVLVEIAKLGTVMMYFKTRDDQYGVVQKKAGLWNYTLLTGAKKIKLVAILFDSLKKQIRQGYFSLPLTIQL